MVRASTGGEPSLEEVKRHMRRISQPCGMEMRQDALLAKGDLYKAHQTLPMPNLNGNLNEKIPVGEAQAVSKEKRKKRKREYLALPCSLDEWRNS